MSHPATPLRPPGSTDYAEPVVETTGPELVVTPPPERTLPERASRARVNLDDRARKVGFAVGRAVYRVRRVPNAVRGRLAAIRGGREAGTPAATTGASATQSRLQRIRAQADRYRNHYPLQTLGGIFGAGTVAGIIIRAWRSRG